MRKLTLIALILFSLSGCAFFQTQKDNWDACKADVACIESAKKWQATGEMVGGIAGSAFPGAAMPAQKGLGYVAFAIAMLLGGHAITKKKEEPK